MKLEGVNKADVDWRKGKVVVEYDPGKVTTSQMAEAVNKSGVFKVKAVENLSGEKGGYDAGSEKKSLRKGN